ncbi:MAG TPA: carboxypeptidase regulatory-like domain-containing protein, partial [Longimicrobium sp.]|nr:carboxypeptidase regulatory-like domain-containing protein [Longimicrobium sp.]
MRLPAVRTLLFLLFLFVALPATAQAQTGAVSGTIRDQATGAGLAGIRVEAVTADGRVAGSATTGPGGTYRIADLAPGEYSLVVSGTDVDVRRLDARISAGATARVDAALAFGNVRLDPLVVSASKRPEKATEAPARTEVVSQQDVEDRPVTTFAEHLRNVPGIDVAQTGLQSSNVVARGFNNIF